MLKKASQNSEAYNLLKLRNPDITYDDKLQHFKDYVDAKANEPRSSYLASTVGGATIGSLVGTLFAFPGRRTLSLIPLGAVIGGLIGYNRASQDNKTIKHYQTILALPESKNKERTLQHEYNTFLMDNPGIHRNYL
jgi:hypothetical protein